MNLMKLDCAKFTLHQKAFRYFIQVSEEGKSENDKGFKIPSASYCISRAILDSAKQTK